MPVPPRLPLAGDGDQSWVAEREFDERVHLCGGADGEECVAE